MKTAPLLRADLAFFPPARENEPWLVQDPIAGSFYPFAADQAVLLRWFDGQSTYDALADRAFDELDAAVPPEQLETLADRAGELGLLDVAWCPIPPERFGKRTRSWVTRRARRELERFPAVRAALIALDPPRAARELDLISKDDRDVLRLRALIAEGSARARRELPAHVFVPISWNPERLLRRLDARLGSFLFSWTGASTILVLMILAGAALVDRPPPPIESFGLVDVIAGFFLHNVLLLQTHELGHGLACTHYGGRVREMGLMVMYWAIPAAFCDVSDSHRFALRRHKAVTLCAGVGAQLAGTSVIVLIYYLTSDGFPLAKPLAVTVGVSSVSMALNFIPLIPLDGYYLLADTLGVLNLRERARSYVGERVQLLLFGLSSGEPAPTPRERSILLYFGVASLIFSFFYIGGIWFITLIPYAARRLGLAGGVLALFVVGRAIVLLFAPPLISVARKLAGGWRTALTVRRALLWAAIAGAVVLIANVRWPELMDGEAVLVPRERSLVSAREEGLVERVAVRDGERVERGQVLIELGNDRLRWERIEVERELELARFALSLLEAGERPERIARANAALEASSSRARWARMNAERASALTSLGSRSQDEADRFGIAAAVLDAESTAASERLAHLRAGARLEDLEAARSFVAELAARHEAIAEAQRRLLIVSPIAGTVVRPHVEDLLHTRVRPGQVLLELHDRDAAYAEIRLFRGQVLNPFAPGTPAVVRLYGDPGHEIETEIALVRATSDPELLATTAIFENTRGWVDGAAGHARIYGERRTLAHQFVAVPILQVLRYSVWRVRGD